jgi:hypothetical protein
MNNHHACSSACPCQKGKDLALAERVAYRYKQSLEVGQSFFTEHLKLHHFHGSLRITDMTNAGKRGKKVQELTLVPTTVDDTLGEKVIKHAVSTILHLNYDGAKSYLEVILKDEKTGNLFTLHERALRGIDVEPMGTKIELENKFPDGSIVQITASPHEFHVNSKYLFTRVDQAPFYQDTLYWPRGKQDGILFYGWLKDNLSKAAHMTIQELKDVWHSLGVRYDSH